MLLARERMGLDFMNVKEEDNCGYHYYNLG